LIRIVNQENLHWLTMAVSISWYERYRDVRGPP
jgi:hypothetical protein